jgi:di/tricarboxylate transporter
MGPPAILVSIITCIMILVLFKPTQEIKINKAEIRTKLNSLGNLTIKEKRVLFWITLAIILWMTDKVHGIDIGWVTIIIAVCMSLPLIGEVLTPASWSGVPIHVLLFLTAAVAIGRIGGSSGMNAFIADAILPDTIPANPLVLAAFITFVSIVIHMILGSCIAVMGIVIPAILIFTQPMGYSPLVPALLAYSAVAVHYILPFQHLNMLVGVGEQNGGYSQKETVKLGVPFIIVVFIMTVLFEMPWWKILGLY